MIRFPQFLSVSALVLFVASVAASAERQPFSSQLAAPIAVYSYADPMGGSGAAPLSEKQALHQVDQLLRLKQAGVHFDYDVINAHGFAATPVHSVQRSDAWPDGPGIWIAKCRASGIRPGLRFNVADWSALNPTGSSTSDITAALQAWYDRGIRLFQFDAESSASGAASAELDSSSSTLLRQAIEAFGIRNRDAVVLFATEPSLQGNSPDSGAANADHLATNVEHTFDSLQLDAFTFVSTGSLRLFAAPQANPWRSVDIQADSAVRRFEKLGIPLAQIRSAGFSMSAGSGLPAWKGAFLLSMARGGWVNSLHGDLATIQPNDARWIARAQQLFLKLQAARGIHSFGGSPDGNQPYGFAGANSHGSVYVVINPGDSVATLSLPVSDSGQLVSGVGRVQFRDAGFAPRLSGNAITLGPGQMALVGYGAYASSAFAFGVQDHVVIPHSIELLSAEFHKTDRGAIEASIEPPINGVLRLVVHPRQATGRPLTADSANASSADDAKQPFTLEVTQYDRPIPVRLDNGSQLGNGMAWTVGEIDVNDLTPGVPIEVHIHSNAQDPPDLEGSAFAIVD